MAVDNLPNEIARDASEGFGQKFMEYIIPALLEGDREEILERALIASGGRLTPRYAYLQDYVDGKE